MKKVLAILALVAVVAISSVAYAAPTSVVTVSGTLSATVDITACTAAYDTAFVAASTSTTTCDTAPTVTANSNYGIAIQSLWSTTTLVNAQTNDTIATLNDAAAGDESCDDSPRECWSFGQVSLSAGTPVYGADKDNGTNGEGTWDTSGDEHGISETLADVLVTDTATGPLSATFDMNFWATVLSTTDAGAYSNANGVLTISANVT